MSRFFRSGPGSSSSSSNNSSSSDDEPGEEAAKATQDLSDDIYLGPDGTNGNNAVDRISTNRSFLASSRSSRGGVDRLNSICRKTDFTS
ncbi:hypothetical protein LTR37_019121 [Vermiconidia calcicola]|uniref:Uncharacterized protein n=1 Tax=Vermiconidia calcicola TaxID=1690605 RepID=A0ACC3MEY0_9PEZI|nr:hypothetical protein LTR37_019121 [Vermiconidia calcicola]